MASCGAEAATTAEYAANYSRGKLDDGKSKLECTAAGATATAAGADANYSKGKLDNDLSAVALPLLQHRPTEAGSGVGAPK